MDLTVDRIDRTCIEVPFRETPRRNMVRQFPEWKYFEIVEVALGSGHVGYGETMLYYTWNDTTADAVDRTLGENAVDVMWDSSLGAGLQIALFDAVGKSLDVPVHSILGEKVHDRIPVSWWANDMPPDDWVEECTEAIGCDYTHIKLKARPWFDIRRQIEAVCDAVPESYHVNLDFNETLLDAERAIPLLKELAEYPQVKMFEGPIHNEDTEGYRDIRRSVDVPIARHYYGRKPEPSVVLREDLCDGFVVSGGVNRALDAGAVSTMANKPFFLELVGTGLTAAFALHVGSVLSNCTWPAVSCNDLYQSSILAEQINIVDGAASVPDGPGLGIPIDSHAIDELQVDLDDTDIFPRRLIETSWPDGRKLYFGSGKQMPEYARDGAMPYYERGVSTRLVPDDGSDEWQQLYEQAREGPVEATESENYVSG